MLDRVGDWFAFSRHSYCRRLTLYEKLPWRRTDAPGDTTDATQKKAAAEGGHESGTAPNFSLTAAQHVALSPFGGLVAVVCGPTDLASFSSALSTDNNTTYCGSSLQCFDLSAHAAAASSATHAAAIVQIFTNAGEQLADVPLSFQEVKETESITAAGWTPEGEFYVLLNPSLEVLFIDVRDIATRGSSVVAPKAPCAMRRVRLRRNDVAAAAAHVQCCDDADSSSAALSVSTEGLVVVPNDGSGHLYGLLHEEKLRSSLLPPVRLPLSVRSASSGAAAASRVPPRQPTVTALDVVPPAWNDTGDFVLLWAQASCAVEGETDARLPDMAKGEDESNLICAMVLQSMVAGEEGDVLDGNTNVARVPLRGRVLSLTVCAADPTRAAAFTARSILYVLRSNLSSALYAVDLGLCRVLRDVAMSDLAAYGTSTANSFTQQSDGPICDESGSGVLTQSFALGEVPWKHTDTDVGGAVNGYSITNPSRGAAATATAKSAGNGKRATHSPLPDDCPQPHKVEWCGSRFVLIHCYQSDYQRLGGDALPREASQQQQQQQHATAPMFSLLACTEGGCSVRCERLDWSLDGSGHIASVAERDGVRIVSDTTCYFLQEVPPCLANLCRVQPPYAATARVVQAYQTYANGDRHGIAQVRAALSTPGAADAAAAAMDQDAAAEGNEGVIANSSGGGVERSHAEGIVYDLLDAASYELNVERQFLLIAAASFAGETIRLRSGIPDVIVDVVRRLRVLRAVREAPQCHCPLTMAQYQVLAGTDEERPSQLLSRTEGQVLVDRLAHLGYYQLALEVVRALKMRVTRVLSLWSDSFLRRHAQAMADDVLYREVTAVLSEFPSASYVEPAATAFQLGRKVLALRLLCNEPQQQRKGVLLCIQMGELTMASRAAAASGSAELIHMVVSALVARGAATRRGGEADGAAAHTGSEEDGRGENMAQSLEATKAASSSPALATTASDDVTTGDVYHCLIACPELLCWLLLGASCLATWQSLAQRLLCSTHWSLASLAGQSMLVQCMRLSTPMHGQQLQEYIAEVVDYASRQRSGGGDTQHEPTQEKQEKHTRKAKKEWWKFSKHLQHHRHEDNDSDREEAEGSSSEDDDDDTRLPLLPPAPPLLHIPVPTAASAAAVLQEWTRKTDNVMASVLQRAEELRRDTTGKSSSSPHRSTTPFSVILERANCLRAQMRGTAAQDDENGEVDAISRGSLPKNGKGGRRGVRGDGISRTNNRTVPLRTTTTPTGPSVLAQEHCVRTVLSTPTTLPLVDNVALAKEARFAKVKLTLAVKHKAPQLSRVVSIADLVFELCGLEGDGEEDAHAVQRSFKVPEKIFCYAKLRGLCAAQRWEAVDRYLGTPPPLQKRSFFSSVDGGRAKAPCIGYLAVVHLLVDYKQPERAARYVAGACAETVDRVTVYMSLNAPIMALEAAMADKDAGLIQQIMQRVPGSATVQSTGQQMLDELRRD